MVFDGALSWEAHVSELSCHCMGVPIGLSHVRHCRGVLNAIMSVLVISLVQCCLTIYGNGPQFRLLDGSIKYSKIFFVRVIFDHRKFDDVLDLRDLLGGMSPKGLADYQTLLTAQNMINPGEPEAPAALFRSNCNTRVNSTRQYDLFHLPLSRLETVKWRFGYRAVALLISLPADIIEQHSARFARTAKAAPLKC